LGEPKVEPKVSTGFFWMIVTALAVPDYNDVFIREMAARYQSGMRVWREVPLGRKKPT
jgi:hypothetical protein